MNISDRYKSSLLEEFLLLSVLVLYYGCVGRLVDSVVVDVDMRIERRYWIQY